MIAALLLAACAQPPLFDMTGPRCTVQTEACRCSECMTWEPSAGAERYEILRHNSSGTTINVGTSRILGGYTDEGVTVPPDPQELWCFAWDSSFVIEGRTYQYEVRACNGTTCSVWGSWAGEPLVTYIAAPYWCWRDGVRGTCR